MRLKMRAHLARRAPAAGRGLLGNLFVVFGIVVGLFKVAIRDGGSDLAGLRL